MATSSPRSTVPPQGSLVLGGGARPRGVVIAGAVGEGAGRLVEGVIASLAPNRPVLTLEMPGLAPGTAELLDGWSADLGVVIVDCGAGVGTETRWLTCLLSVFGIRRVVLLIDAPDSAACTAPLVAKIAGQYATVAVGLGIEPVAVVPVSTRAGDNVTSVSAHLAWYDGPTLRSALEAAVAVEDCRDAPLRVFVERADRQEGAAPGAGTTRVIGTVVAGTAREGDRVRVLPSGRETVIAGLGTSGAPVDVATGRPPAALTLADAMDLVPGDVVAAASAPAEVADQFETRICWMGESPLLVGRQYDLRRRHAVVPMQVTGLKHRLHVDTLEHVAARTLGAHEIGVCTISVARPIGFDAVHERLGTAGFVVVDPATEAVAGLGTIQFALRRSRNIHRQAVDVDKQARAAIKGQQPCVLWFTGLSGAGKSTVANLVERQLNAMGRHTYLLDGDNVRHGLSRDLGFTAADRVENIRRIGEVAKLMVDAGLIVLTAFISPFRAERRLARGLVADGEFLEIFVDAPLSVAESRDPKGLYAKARRGELKNFTGIDSPYEPPEHPELVLPTAALSPGAAAGRVIDLLRQRGCV